MGRNWGVLARRPWVPGTVAMIGGAVALVGLLCVPAAATAAPSNPLFPVRGQVTAADTGRGLPGVCVVISQSGRYGSYYRGTTDADGKWLIWGVGQGVYGVSFDPDCQGMSPYLAQVWNNGASIQVPDPVQFVNGVNASLALGAYVSGHVTDERSGAPIAGQAVSVSGPPGPQTLVVGGGSTDSSGAYRIKIAAGTYQVLFTCYCLEQTLALRPPNPAYADEWFLHQASQSTAQSFTLQPGQSVVADTTLSVGGIVSGTVTDAATGQPAQGVTATMIAVGDINNPYANEYWTPVAADGSYSIVGLPANQYYAYFRGGNACPYHSAYPNQYWTGTATDRQPIDVQTYSTVTSINVAMTC